MEQKKAHKLIIMKKTFLVFILLTTLSSCSKDDNNQALPPATQTGAGTFACYVNGQAFIDTSGNFNCFYQLIDGNYFFHITAHDIVEGIDEITIYSEKVKIEEGKTYQLTNLEEFHIAGIVFFEKTTSSANSTTISPGTLTITKLDSENFIVSGTFSFNVTHPITNNNIIISEGRFDSLFTI